MFWVAFKGVLTPTDAETEAYAKNREGKVCQLKEIGHSEAQHHTIFDLMQWHWKNYHHPRIRTFDEYRARMCYRVGHLMMVPRRVPEQTIYKMIEDLNASVVRRSYRIEIEIPKSMSHGATPAAEFNQLTKDIESVIAQETGVTIDIYLANKFKFRQAGD